MFYLPPQIATTTRAPRWARSLVIVCAVLWAYGCANDSDGSENGAEKGVDDPEPVASEPDSPGSPTPNAPRTARFGDLDRGMLYPTRVAVSDDGTIYISDVEANAVFAYRNGRRISQLSGLDRPLGLAVHSNRLFVGLLGSGAVEAYDLVTKKFVHALGTGPGAFEKPNAIAIGNDGTAFVVDSARDVVEIFGADGLFRRQIGGRGTENGQFRAFHGVFATGLAG